MARKPTKPVPIRTDKHEKLEEVAAFHDVSMKKFLEQYIDRSHAAMLRKKAAAKPDPAA